MPWPARQILPVGRVPDLIILLNLRQKTCLPVGPLSSNQTSFCKQRRGYLPRGEALPTLIVSFTLRKEVIQPQVLLRLPCYDFTPITTHTLDGYLPKVESPASSTNSFRDVTGGVYKARERIHRGMLIRDY